MFRNANQRQRGHRNETSTITVNRQPDWWDALTSDPNVLALGIEWKRPEDWTPPEDDSIFGAGTMDVVSLTERHEAISGGKLLVGTGPTVTRRVIPIDADVHWYLDPGKPDALWSALGYAYPAWLWVPVEPTAEALAEVLSSSHPTPALERTELTETSRGFLGFMHQVMVPNVYSGDMVDLNGLDLDRYMTMVHYVDAGFWGSHWQDDPMSDAPGEAGPIGMLAFKNDYLTGAQRIGRVPSMTWRTLHSRSYVSFEVHQRDVVCAAVRYRPSPASHQKVVAQINEELNGDFPVDMPLDAIGALTGFNFARESGLIDNLTEPESTEYLIGGLRAFAALWSGDLRQTRRLREFTDHPDTEVRLTLARIATWYCYRFLLQDLALAETDPDLIDELETMQMRLGSGPGDNYNAFGDYFSETPVMVDSDGHAVEVVNPPDWDDDYEDDEEEGES
jgi:hypothetical protein